VIAYKRQGSGDPVIVVNTVAEDRSGLSGLAGLLAEHFTVHCGREPPAATPRRAVGPSGPSVRGFSSGTVDSIVYDTVLEETGSNELYEKWIGRTRAVESGAFVFSALVGGLLAQYTSARFTYFATVPLVALAIIGFLRFNEPRLHKAAERVNLRSHVALTFRTMITSRAVLRVMFLVAAAGLLAQAVFEFGPLWLVAQAAPAALYGPYWAALVVLGLGLAIIGIHAGRLLHDAVPSSIRAGVSSGAGTLTSVLFLPFSLVFGWVARENGINWSGFMLTGAVVIVGMLLVISIRVGLRTAPAEAATAKQEALEVTESTDELACKQLVELVDDYLEDVLSPEVKARFEEHLAGCDGCTTYLSQTQQIIAELRDLSAQTHGGAGARLQ
jgi:hypothetical protein